MRRWRCVTAAAMTIVLAPPSGAVLPFAEGASATVRELVFFGVGNPVRFRLHLQVHGRPLEEAWSQAVATLFNYCDRNGDGVLDKEERAIIGQPQPGRNQGRLRETPLDAANSTAQLQFDPKADRLTRAAFAAKLQEAGFGMVTLNVKAAQPQSRELSQALFKHLDRDRNGRLSVAELKNARESLAVLDVNEDDIISTEELLERAVVAVGRQAAMPPRDLAEPVDATSEFLLLPGEPAAAAKELLGLRGGRGQFIRPAEFGGATRAFRVLDTNSDGKLDHAELETWLRRLPELELALSLGSGQPPGKLSVLPGMAGPGKRLQIEASREGTVNAAETGARYHFAQPDSQTGDGFSWRNVVNRVRDRTGAMAKAGNLIREQLTGQTDLDSFFNFADRNRDGKVDDAERKAALAVLDRMAECRIVLDVTDFAAGLFELLDTNRDSRLSPRELVDAATNLKPYFGPAGDLTQADLPRRLTIAAHFESIKLVLPTPSPAPSSPLGITKGPTDLPSWFMMMDRNGDGEVSLREFLGPLELFRKLDRNSDGLVSPDEARDFLRKDAR